MLFTYLMSTDADFFIGQVQQQHLLLQQLLFLLQHLPLIQQLHLLLQHLPFLQHNHHLLILLASCNWTTRKKLQILEMGFRTY
jgi:hypothetical protein